MSIAEKIIEGINRRIEHQMSWGHPVNLEIARELRAVVEEIREPLNELQAVNNGLLEIIARQERDIEHGEQAAIRRFLSRLDDVSGTGSGIGAATVEKIRQFAIREGFLPPGGANER